MHSYNPRILRVHLLTFLYWLAACSLCGGQDSGTPKPDKILVQLNAPAQPFPHFWEQMFGSGRAILSLRDDYRHDLEMVKESTDFTFIRFHGILDDEVGLYGEDTRGIPHYNFSYVDQIYDGLLARGVRPFVELSFMPAQLAAKPALHSFWYKPNTSPPKDWDRWDALISAFAQHLIERYGKEEVDSWYFEVWNEPNLDFWTGEPQQATYWTLYDHTSQALKRVDSKLRVGGPATAQAAWVAAFIEHCVANKIPIDFVSTHVYGDDSAEDVFGKNAEVPRNQMVCLDVRKVHDQIEASPRPDLPLIWSEFNATYRNLPEITDSTYMGPWLADTIRQCDGLTSMMSYWDFSDVFEEQGVVKMPFYGGYGLIAERSIPKPAYNAFRLFHLLGHERIPVNDEPVLITKGSDGKFVIALWNYYGPEQKGHSQVFELTFSGGTAKRAIIYRLDEDHGDVRKAYSKMGSPTYPTEGQIAALQIAAEMPAPIHEKIKQHELTISIPPRGLVLLQVH